jgi:drug/metabolite transporter (DMT)-like permease
MRLFILKNNKALVSSIALAIVALCWGAAYSVIKDALISIQPFQLMTLRFGLSSILLSLIFFKRLKRITKKDLYRGLIIGAFMFLAFLTMIIGLSYTTASKQAFLIGSYVLIVPFFAWIISKQRPGSYAIIGALLATIGIGLLTLNGSLSINKGDIISILCSIFFACHMVSIEYFSKEADPIISTIIQFTITAILFIILTGIFESYKINFTSHTIKGVAYIVVISTVIAFAIQNVAQKYISATSTALILTLESGFGGVCAIIFLKELMTPQMIIGGIIILIGIITEETKWSFIRNKAKLNKGDLL